METLEVKYAVYTNEEIHIVTNRQYQAFSLWFREKMERNVKYFTEINEAKREARLRTTKYFCKVKGKILTVQIKNHTRKMKHLGIDTIIYHKRG